MYCPLGVRSNLLGKVVTGRPVETGGRVEGVVGSAGTVTGSSCCPADRVGSNSESVPCGTPDTTPVPAMLISTRPSLPTSTP